VEASLQHEAKATANGRREFVVLLKQRRRESRLQSDVSPRAAVTSRMKPSSALRTVSDRKYLLSAWKEISKRNPSSRGLDDVTIRAFKGRLEENLSEISSDLRANAYIFNKLRAHAISKGGSKKMRPLQIATVRDRVVMKALALFIEHDFAPLNLDCSYAFIRGRGVSKAISRIRELLEQGNKFYFEADIINFFGEVNRDTLWQMFSRKVRQRSLLPLLRQCFRLELEDLDSYKPEFQELFIGTGSGIPQGGVLSPMLANFYLYEFDRRMILHGFNLVRYADDFVVLCESQAKAQQAHDFARAVLTTLNLRIHDLGATDSKSKIGYFPKDGLTFLGVRFEGREIFPTSKVVQRFKSKVEEVLKPESGLSLFKTLQRLRNLIDGWGKCYRAMRVYKLYLELDAFTKTSIESYLEHLGIRLLGTKRGKQMRLLGVPSLTAMVQFSKPKD
jgi:RNA-directed DNA polymerase